MITIKERLNIKTVNKIAEMLLGENKEFGFKFLKRFQEFILEKYEELHTCVLYVHSVDFVRFLKRNGYSEFDIGRREILIVKNCIKYTSDYAREPIEIDIW